MLKQAMQKPTAALKEWASANRIPPANVWVTNVCSDVWGVIGSLGAVTPFPVWLSVKPDCIEDKGDRRAHSGRTGSLSRFCSSNRYFNLLKRWRWIWEDTVAAPVRGEVEFVPEGCVRTSVTGEDGWFKSQKELGFDSLHYASVSWRVSDLRASCRPGNWKVADEVSGLFLSPVSLSRAAFSTWKMIACTRDLCMLMYINVCVPMWDIPPVGAQKPVRAYFTEGNWKKCEAL